MKTIPFYILLFTLAVFTPPAKASSWMECKVEATITEIKESSIEVEVISGVIIAGYHEKGRPCLKQGDLYDVRTDSEDLEVDQTISLHYKYYDSMTPNGFVSNTQWEILSVSEEDQAITE